MQYTIHLRSLCRYKFQFTECWFRNRSQIGLFWHMHSMFSFHWRYSHENSVLISLGIIVAIACYLCIILFYNFTYFRGVVITPKPSLGAPLNMKKLCRYVSEEKQESKWYVQIKYIYWYLTLYNFSFVICMDTLFVRFINYKGRTWKYE